MLQRMTNGNAAGLARTAPVLERPSSHVSGNWQSCADDRMSSTACAEPPERMHLDNSRAGPHDVSSLATGRSWSADPCSASLRNRLRCCLWEGPLPSCLTGAIDVEDLPQHAGSVGASTGLLLNVCSRLTHRRETAHASGRQVRFQSPGRPVHPRWRRRVPFHFPHPPPRQDATYQSTL